MSIEVKKVQLSYCQNLPVAIVAAEIFWKFPEWKISGNFRKFPTSFFHFLTGYWKFILLIISRPKCHRIIF